MAHPKETLVALREPSRVRAAQVSARGAGRTLPDAAHYAERLRLFALVYLVPMVAANAALAIYFVATNGFAALSRPWVIVSIATTVSWVPPVFAKWLSAGSARRVLWIDTACSLFSAVTGAIVTVASGPLLARALGARLAASPAVLAAVAHQEAMLAGVIAFSVAFTLHAALVPATVWRRIRLVGILSLIFSVAVLVPTAEWVGEAGPDYQLSWDVRVGATQMAAILMVLLSATALTVGATVRRLEVRVRKAEELGQYRLEEKLGEGGMGVVYRASHGMLRRPTALKLLLPEKAGSEEDVARFEREVQLAARLIHPNTITIYDYGRTPEGVFYYAMELLDGADLESLVERRGAMPPARVVNIIKASAAALGEAHGQGLVHRDIKPGNIFLCRERGGQPDVVKVLDFGLVKSVDDHATKVSREGMVPGTPMYMPPEALRGGPPDPRSDLYALGGVAYFLLTGREPFETTSLAEIIAAQLHVMPRLPSVRSGKQLPEDLEALVMVCLDKDPARRPQTAAELLERLEACRDIGTWTDKDARSWWERTSATSVRSLRPTESAPTLEAQQPQVAKPSSA